MKPEHEPTRDEKLVATYIRVLAATAKASGQADLASLLGVHLRSLEQGDRPTREMVAACADLAEGESRHIAIHFIPDTSCPHGPN
ncbi:MAG: hypothetical protein H6713_32500 [Myxococcales bacterium]|nr:hypothetical protein [Myxococcales bacterium]MCB9754682.1 hypothetical protein [Myxococcales bacterium]